MKRNFKLSLLLLTASCTGGSQPEHGGDVVLITVDALRSDFISSELTPTIHQLAAEGLSFANARANSSHPLQSSATAIPSSSPQSVMNTARKWITKVNWRSFLETTFEMQIQLLRLPLYHTTPPPMT